MTTLSEKEKEYIELENIVGDDQQPHQQQINPIWSDEIKPTWNIVNWLRTRNITEDDTLTGRTLYYDDEFLGYDSVKEYVEVKLLSNGIQPKYENEWK